MSEFIRCEICQGKKTVLGLGSLEKKCTPCLGVGYVKPTDTNAVTDTATENLDGIVKRKRKAKWDAETL